MAQDKAADIVNFAAARNAAGIDGSEKRKPDGEPAGAFLAAIRTESRFSVEAVSDAIKVKPDHIEAIERGDFSALPALPYALGFVKSYAAFLGVDIEAVATQFRTDRNGALPEPLVSQATTTKDVDAPNESVKAISIAAIIGIVLLMIWVTITLLSKASNNANPGGSTIILVDTPDALPSPKVVAEPLPSVTMSEPAAEETPARIENGTVPAPVAEIAATEEPTEAQAEPAVQQRATDSIEERTQPIAVQETVETELENISAIQDEAAQTEPATIEPDATPAQAPTAPLEPAPIIETVTEPVIEATIFPAVLTRSIAPDYPARCDRDARDVESVTLQFDVSTRGRATNARVTSSTNPCFDAEALSTIARWRFNPKSIDGAPAVDAGKTATLNFRK